MAGPAGPPTTALGNVWHLKVKTVYKKRYSHVW